VWTRFSWVKVMLNVGLFKLDNETMVFVKEGNFLTLPALKFQNWHVLVSRFVSLYQICQAFWYKNITNSFIYNVCNHCFNSTKTQLNCLYINCHFPPHREHTVRLTKLTNLFNTVHCLSVTAHCDIQIKGAVGAVNHNCILQWLMYIMQHVSALTKSCRHTL